MSGYVVAPEANADLLRMWFHIAQDSEEIADRVHGEFYDKFGPWLSFPAKFTAAPTTRRPMYRSFPFIRI